MLTAHPHVWPEVSSLRSRVAGHLAARWMIVEVTTARLRRVRASHRRRRVGAADACAEPAACCPTYRMALGHSDRLRPAVRSTLRRRRRTAHADRRALPSPVRPTGQFRDRSADAVVAFDAMRRPGAVRRRGARRSDPRHPRRAAARRRGADAEADGRGPRGGRARSSRAAAIARLTAAVNFQLRFSPNMLALRDLLDARRARRDRRHRGPHRRSTSRGSNGRSSRRRRASRCSYHSIHYLDAIRWLAGEPAGVHCRASRIRRSPSFATRAARSSSTTAIASAAR